MQDLAAGIEGVPSAITFKSGDGSMIELYLSLDILESFKNLMDGDELLKSITRP